MEKIKQKLIKTAKKLSKNGLSPGFSGNISARYGRYFIISPSGFSLGDLEPEDLVLIDENKKVIDGKNKPSSEAQLHIEIYKIRPDIGAVIHCHAPKSSAFAVSDIPLSLPILTENVFHLGEIPVAEYYLPSTQKVAEETAKYFDNHDVVLMQNHGVVLGGRDLKEVYYRMETVEYSAEVIINTKILGNPKLLSPEEIREIEDLKEKFARQS